MASINGFSAQLKSDAGVVYDTLRHNNSLFKTVTVIIQHDFDGDIPRGKKAIAAALETYTDLYLCGIPGGSVALTRSKIYANANPCELEGYADELAALLENNKTNQIKEAIAEEEAEDASEEEEPEAEEETDNVEDSTHTKVMRFRGTLRKFKIAWPKGLSEEEAVSWVKENHPTLYSLPKYQKWSPTVELPKTKKMSKKKVKRGGAKELSIVEVPLKESRFPAMFVEVRFSVAEIIVIKAGLESLSDPAAEKLLSELKPLLEV